MDGSVLSSFKTEHHYVSGLALTGIGLIGILGSLTGSLAAMMAGLFCNSNGANTALYSTGSVASAATANKTAAST